MKRPPLLPTYQYPDTSIIHFSSLGPSTRDVGRSRQLALPASRQPRCVHLTRLWWVRFPARPLRCACHPPNGQAARRAGSRTKGADSAFPENAVAVLASRLHPLDWTAHSSRSRYCSKILTFLPAIRYHYELVMTTTFGTSQGPTQPLIVNWTWLQQSPLPPFVLERFQPEPRANPRSVLPQQHPLQIVTCPTTKRCGFKGVIGPHVQQQNPS